MTRPDSPPGVGDTPCDLVMPLSPDELAACSCSGSRCPVRKSSLQTWGNPSIIKLRDAVNQFVQRTQKSPSPTWRQPLQAQRLSQGHATQGLSELRSGFVAHGVAQASGPLPPLNFLGWWAAELVE